MPVSSAMTGKDYARLAEARSRTYLFLSAIYVQALTCTFVERILSENFQIIMSYLTKNEVSGEVEDGVRLIKKFIRESKGDPLERRYTNLSVDRTRLFKGVKPGYGPTPPYESAYLDGGSLMTKSTLEVMATYKRVGVAPSAGWNEPVDYIGIELDFMHLLCARESEAWDSDDPNEASKYVSLEYEFLKDHLARWVPLYCDRMYDEANTDFYKGIAKVTKGFTLYDHARMKDYVLAGLKPSSINRLPSDEG